MPEMHSRPPRTSLTVNTKLSQQGQYIAAARPRPPPFELGFGTIDGSGESRNAIRNAKAIDLREGGAGAKPDARKKGPFLPLLSIPPFVLT